MPIIEQIIYCKSILNRMMLYNPMLIPSKKDENPKEEKKDDYNDYPTEFYSISKNSKNKVPENVVSSNKQFFSEVELKKMAKNAGIKLD